MKFIDMLKKHLHISTKTVIYLEMTALSALCLSIFLYRTDSGQAVMSQAARLAGYINPLEDAGTPGQDNGKEKKKEYTKWVEFHVTAEAMNQALDQAASLEDFLGDADVAELAGLLFGRNFGRALHAAAELQNKTEHEGE